MAMSHVGRQRWRLTPLKKADITVQMILFRIEFQRL